MINYDSILSAFDGKPTLLQWLKMVKKALDESILKNVNITQNGEKVVFTFNFEDGTSISTPEVTLPKGDKGDKGDKGADIVRIETTGSAVVGVNTESTIRVELSDGSVKQFKTYAKNGSDGVNGTDGVSITGINTVSSEVVGDETLTTLRANYSNDTTDEFVVTAKNGKDATASGSMYLHSVRFYSGPLNIYFNLYSTKRSLTYEDALSQIPKDYKIPACIVNINKLGVVLANKEGVDAIRIKGLVYDTATSTTEFYQDFYSFSNSSFNDTLLGENL